MIEKEIKFVFENSEDILKFISKLEELEEDNDFPNFLWEWKEQVKPKEMPYEESLNKDFIKEDGGEK